MRGIMLRIGPSGNSKRFYDEGHTHTYEAGRWLYEQGLNAFEYSFGHGVSMSQATANKIREEMNKYDVEISAHAPYYTNFANPDDEMIEKSIGYVLKSVAAVKMMGGRRVVFHPASCGKQPRDVAFDTTLRNFEKLSQSLEESGTDDFIVSPETMGKLNQIGTVDEILQLCKLSRLFYPCFDFGHINCYTKGGIKTSDDYKRIIDKCFEALGEEKTKNMHVHFSKIQYGNSGELRHLTFEDNVYGPEYAPLAKVIDEYRLTPFVVCESNGTMADDAIIMKNCHQIFY